jgi:hypothetical protein
MNQSHSEHHIHSNNKKAYTNPELIRYGNITNITKANEFGVGTVDGAMSCGVGGGASDCKTA